MSMSPKMTALLRVFVYDGGPLTPNEAGYMLLRTPHRVSRQGRSMGPGSLIVPTLRALERRGWIEMTRRPDGRSGMAYRVTSEGRSAFYRLNLAREASP